MFIALSSWLKDCIASDIYKILLLPLHMQYYVYLVLIVSHSRVDRQHLPFSGQLYAA
jgi:hypothetical protein